MMLDTVQVKVSEIALFDYLKRLDERGEVYSFTVSPSNHALVLSLNRDGDEDMFTVALKTDGTWCSYAHLIVGEKREL